VQIICENERVMIKISHSEWLGEKRAWHRHLVTDWVTDISVYYINVCLTGIGYHTVGLDFWEFKWMYICTVDVRWQRLLRTMKVDRHCSIVFCPVAIEWISWRSWQNFWLTFGQNCSQQQNSESISCFACMCSKYDHGICWGD